MRRIMIEALSLSKKYGDLLAVKDLNLMIDNELFGFLGANGAGKTTTIKMMTGLISPTDGKIKICGIDINENPRAAKSQFGLLPDNPFLYEKLSAIEFLNFMGDLYKVDSNTLIKRINNLLELFDLKDRAQDLIETYSFGMKQKVALAGALIHNPKVLFLDEPTVGLDPKSTRIIKDILKGLVREGITIFMSTHILEVAEAMCDRIGIIDKGELIECGTMKELRGKSKSTEKNLENIFLELTGGDEYVDVLKYLRED